MRLHIVAAVLVWSLAGFAQSDSPVIKRGSYNLKIVVNKDSVYEYNIRESSFILQDQVIQLYPAEIILVEVDQTANIIKNIKVVQQNTHPHKTIKISFTQNTQNGVHKNMTLAITNPFTKDLYYSARLLLAKSNKWTKTDVVPIKAGLSSFEIWPDVISSIVLKDWTFVNE